MRLSYAIELRYGVRHDLAAKLPAGEPSRAGHGPRQHVVWQGVANGRILRALAHCTSPATALNPLGCWPATSATGSRPRANRRRLPGAAASRVLQGYDFSNGPGSTQGGVATGAATVLPSRLALAKYAAAIRSSTLHNW